jgi:thiol-disulfide isomerase/thioredoxin
VVLNFWASYCIPCRKEFPLFKEQLAKDAGRFVVLGVDAKDIESDAEHFAKEQKATWPIVVDSDNDVAQAYGIGAVPQTFFIKPNGKVALRYYAGIPDDDWADSIAKITRPPGG